MLRTLIQRLLTLRCVVCEQISALRSDILPTPICPDCESDFFSTDTRRCERCAISMSTASLARTCGRCVANPPHFDATIALADYVSPVDGMVVALKFTARLDLANFFGRLLAQRVSAQPLRMPSNLIIPVPLAFERLQQRGFNQSHQIARVFAAATGERLAVDRLIRVRHTPPQQSLKLAERHRNVRNAFAVEGSLTGNTIYVIDDVMTSGSTLDEIARVLKLAGAARVVNLVVARTP